MGLRSCTSVRPGTPISASEWKDPRQAELYREYWGKPRCVCGRQGLSNNRVSMTEMCARAGLVHKVGNTIFKGDDNMGKRGEYQEVDALDASLEDFAALIETYNLKAVGMGAGVGAITGVAVPGLMRVLPSGKWWNWVKLLSPLAITGTIAALLAKKQPVLAVALVAGGGTLTAATLANKFFFKDVGAVGLSFDAPKSLVEGAADAVANAGAAAALPDRTVSDSVDDFLLVAGNGGNGDQDLNFAGTELNLGRLEPLFANEDQADGLQGLSLQNENVYSDDLSFMV